MATIDVLLSTSSQKGAKVASYIPKNSSGGELPYCTILDSGTNGGQVCVTLPMPTQIMSMDKPLWEMEEYGTESTLSNHLAMGNNFENWLRNTIESKKGAITAGLAHIISNTNASYMRNDAARYVRHMNGLVEMPLREMVFKGVDFRTLSFNWQLVPLNENDSTAISKAIKVLQFYSLPVASSELPGAFGVMGYPLLWRVVFGYTKKGVIPNLLNNNHDERAYTNTGNVTRTNKYGGQKVGQLAKSEHLPVFKDVAITNISMDYTGAGKAVFHKKNAPVQVNLSIQFAETTMHVANDVENGFHL